MFTEPQLQSLTELATINPEVKMLLDFYLEAQADGVKTIRLTLNAKLLSLSKELERKDCIYDITYEQIIETSKVLKKLPKPPKPEKEAKGKRGKGENSVAKKGGHEGKAVL